MFTYGYPMHTVCPIKPFFHVNASDIRKTESKNVQDEITYLISGLPLVNKKKKKKKRRGYHFYKLGILIAVHCWALGHDGNTVFTYVQSQRKRVTVKTLKQEHKDLHEEYSVTQHHRLEEEWIYYHVIPSLKSGKTIYTPHTTLVDGLYDTEGTCENNMKQRRYTLV